MLTIHPQYIKDINGKNSLVVLPAEEFDILIEEVETIEDIQCYDEAKASDTGERITMENAFKIIEENRKK